MLSLVYAISLIFISIVLLILFAAIDIFVDISKKGPDMHHMVHVKWLFISHVLNDRTRSSEGSNDPDLDEFDQNDVLGSTKDEGKNEDTDKIKSKDEKSSKFKWNVQESIAALKLVIKPVVRLLEGLLTSIEIHSFKCDLRFGFDDPANTGMVYGYIHVLKGYLLQKCKKLELDVEPVFIDESLVFFTVANFRIRPVSLIPVIFRFIFNRNVLRVSWAYLRNKSISR